MTDQSERARANELRSICLELKLSQRRMSRLLGLHVDVIRHMCSGHYAVTLDVLLAARRRLAEAKQET
jgi:plasmid maintenance system antidote protein VapI